MLSRLLGKTQPPSQEQTEPKKHFLSPLSGLFSQSERAEIRRARVLEDVIAKNMQVPQPIETVRAEKGVAMDSGYSTFKTASLTQPNIPELVLNWYGNQGFIGFQMCAILAQHWLIEKACSMAPRDAVRMGYQIKSADGSDLDPERLKQITKLNNEKYRLDWNLEQFARFNRIFGTRVAIFKVKSEDPKYYEKPFNPDGVTKGSYEGISQVDPYWMTPALTFEDGADPSSIDFYQPTYWNIGGRKYHRSHLAFIVYNEVPDILKPTYRYAGVSLPQKIYERVYGAERTANEAPLLAMTKRLNTFKMDTTQAFTNEQQFCDSLQFYNTLRDNYGMRVYGLNEEVGQLDTSLADLDSVIMTQYQLVAAIANVPSTKLLGTTPKGFSSTGEYEEANYHEELESIQTHELDPLMQRHLLMLARSEFGKDVDFIAVWNELDSPTAKEAAEIEKIEADTCSVLAQTGAIDGVDIRKRLATDPSSGFFGISDELPETMEPEEAPELDEDTAGSLPGDPVDDKSAE